MALAQNESSESGVGQIALPATTLTAVYVMPASQKWAVRYLRALFLCNRGAAGTFRLSYAPAGAADDNSQYLYYGTAIAANDTLLLDLGGFRLSPLDEIRVYASSADMSCTVMVDSK